MYKADDMLKIVMETNSSKKKQKPEVQLVYDYPTLYYDPD